MTQLIVRHKLNEFRICKRQIGMSHLNCYMQLHWQSIYKCQLKNRNTPHLTARNN